MADEDTQDVAAASSPATPGGLAEPQGGAPAPEAVSSDVVLPDDRPAHNLKAEFDRKFTKVEQQMAQMLQAMQQMAAQRPAPPPATSHEYTDEQLAQLAVAGNAEAQRLLTERHTARAVQSQLAQQQAQSAHYGVLSGLYQRYPVLQDTSHPLTQKAMQAKMLIVQQAQMQGRSLAPMEADVQAITLAVADSPDLVAQMHGARTVPQGSPAAAMTGSTPRRPVPASSGGQTSGRKLSDKERQIAARMGVKDPSKAVDRFFGRQEQARSSVSPSVAGIVREQGGV